MPTSCPLSMLIRCEAPGRARSGRDRNVHGGGLRPDPEGPFLRKCFLIQPSGSSDEVEVESVRSRRVKWVPTEGLSRSCHGFPLK